MTLWRMIRTPSTAEAAAISSDAAPATPKASEEVLAWQAEKIRAGLKAADEGRFVTPEAVAAVVQKYSRNA